MATPKQQVLSYQPDVPKVAQRTPSLRSLLPGKMLSGTRLRARIWSLVARGRYTLSGQFVVLAVLLFLSSLGMMGVVSQQLQVTQAELNTIAIKSVPSVDAAQRLLQYIQDVDAKAADYISAATLTDTQPCEIIGTNRVEPVKTHHECAALNIDVGLALANDEVYRAIRNAAYPGERTALDRIAAGLDEYKAYIMISRHEYELAGANFNPKNDHLIKAKDAYYAARDVLSSRITGQPVSAVNDEKSTDVPSCVLNVRISAKITLSTLSPEKWRRGSLEQNIACLTSINKQHLDDTYKQAVEHLGLTLLIASISSVAFCLLLLYTIWRVTRLTHYVFHFTLMVVTLASIIFSVFVVKDLASLYGQQGVFKAMVKDAYDSVYHSALIQQYTTAANAAESRWLIAVAFNDQDQIVRWQEDWEYNKATVIGLMFLVQGERTGSEEEKLLADMQNHWREYTAIDPQIRAEARDVFLESVDERIKNAQALRFSRSSDEFSEFSGAVDKFGSVNRAYLDSTYNRANGFLTTYVPLCFVLYPLVGALAGLSVLRRRRDF